MIHRDVKPDNLMVNTQGIVKVADLGLVRTPGMADEKPLSEEAAPTPKTATRRPSKPRSVRAIGITRPAPRFPRSLRIAATSFGMGVPAALRSRIAWQLIAQAD